MARSFRLFRNRGLSIAVIVVVFGLVPGIVIRLLPATGYQRGSHDLPSFLFASARYLVPGLLWFLMSAGLMRASLDRPGRAGPLQTLRSTLAVLPTLAPIWIASEYGLVWVLFDMWTGNRPSHDSAAMTRTAWLTTGIAGVEVAILFGAFAAVGLLTPVVLAERRGLIPSIARTWRVMGGNRWKLIALYFLYFVSVGVVDFVLAELGAGFRVAHNLFAGAVLQWTQFAIGLFSATLWYVVLAACYVELREIREGPPDAQLAEVFA